MLSFEDAKARVACGAALLDKQLYTWDWRAKLNLETLDLSSSEACVLGQVYDGGYWEGIGCLFGFWNDHLSTEQAAEVEIHGFLATNPMDCAMLQRAWTIIFQESQSLVLIIQNMDGWSESDEP